MKRLIRNLKKHLSYTIDIRIDIFDSNNIAAATQLDDPQYEYESLVSNIFKNFKSRGYELIEEGGDDMFTHKSNRKNSASEYFTFCKEVTDIVITIVVNLRVSDHRVKKQSRRSKWLEEKLGPAATAKVASNPSFTRTYDIQVIVNKEDVDTLIAAQGEVQLLLDNIEDDIDRLRRLREDKAE